MERLPWKSNWDTMSQPASLFLEMDQYAASVHHGQLAAEASNEIEVTADGVARGVSLAGDAFIATKSSDRVSNIGDGRPWETTVTTVNGETFHYAYNDFTTFSVAELESYGIPTVYATTGSSGLQPGVYTVIWLTVDHRFGFSGLLFGRSGDVKRGVPGTNIWTGGGDPTL